MPRERNNDKDDEFEGSKWGPDEPRCVFIRPYIIQSLILDCHYCDALRNSEVYNEIKRNLINYAPKSIEKIYFKEFPCEWKFMEIERYTDKEVQESEWERKTFDLDEETLNYLMAIATIDLNFPQLEIIWQTHGGQMCKEYIGGLFFYGEEDVIMIHDVISLIFETMRLKDVDPNSWKKFQHEKTRLASTRGDVLIQHEVKKD
ncbi:MAG: hypothetical protein ACFFAS_06950 [Promethearchaeota archaeon]